LDDDAVAFVHSALAAQNNAVRQISDHMNDASIFIKWVIYGSLILTLLLVGVAVSAGTIFAGRLAARLGRVRGKAESIGAGDLSANLEVVGADEIDQIAATFNDMVKALRSSRQQMEHDSLHDSLTELPNRALFKERLGRRFLEAKRHNDYEFAVLFLDLDHFKLVNDSLGHAIGDELLRVVATRLQQIASDHGLRMDGENTLSRLGGDEFTILLDHVNGIDDAATVAKSIKSSLALPMQIEDNELTITSSVGVVVASAQTVDAKTLMSEADAALYRAKDAGRNGYAIFDASMRDEVIQRLALENNLRRALERKEFVLYFQPIFDLASGRLAGFEALIRWAQGGELVRPDLFIPIAEETGQIVEIGQWVIEEACAQFQQWRSTYGGPPMLTLNVSRRQLIDSNLVPHLRRVLAKTGLPPSSLIVEITESVLGDAAATFETLTAIRALGVLIYIDDFGTGYSTLSSLHRLPIDGIKIDKSFMKKGDIEGNQRTVLNTVVQLAHRLDIPVVAEGIETPDQLAIFQGISCDHGQGFYFAKPLTSADAERLLATSAVAKPHAA
jgi:diguanylate cyclase (GGDEF)-like protein